MSASSFTKTLPASWYTSTPLYQLERRAVFDKSWYLLGPVTRFLDPSEDLKYEFAQRTIRVQAISIQTTNPADSRIDVYETESETKLRSHITPTGLLFTTISDAAPSFYEFFPKLEETLAKVDFTKLPHRRSVKYEGNFNWKTMIDGYQECLHCQYTHPSFSVLYPPTFYAVENHTNFCQHIADPSKREDGLFLYFFPNCTLNVYGGGMSSFRVCPSSKTGVARMEFDYYHLESGEKFEEYYKFVRQVASEDFELCEKAQHNLERGVYETGILNPVKETGVAYYQGRVLDLVTKQFEEERDATTSELQQVPTVDQVDRAQIGVV